jgi:tRNA modification GTPase
MNEPICAISTAPGRAAIGIVRLCGKSCFFIAQQIIKAPDSFDSAHARELTHCELQDNDQFIDDALFAKFVAPHSYSGEDMVEFYCHGNQHILDNLLKCLIAKGARLAMPGEFTKRAFLNGKIDLLQAEAVSQLITAKSERGVLAAGKLMTGFMSRQVTEIVDCLIDLQAEVEARIDFPEDENPTTDEPALLSRLNLLADQIQTLISWLSVEKPFLEETRVVIVGKPNSGKSTLFNRILGKERAIVTEFAGTTRDVISEKKVVDGLVLEISDTAGLAETADAIEVMGMEKTQQKLLDADLIIHLYDATNFDLQKCEQAELKYAVPHMVVLNKCDLIERHSLGLLTGHRDWIMISAATGEGMTEFLTEIKTRLSEPLFHGPCDRVSASSRQYHLLTKALAKVEEAGNLAMNHETTERWEVELMDARRALEELTGKSFSATMLDRIFSRFCIGK